MSCRAPFQPEDQYEQLRRPAGVGVGAVAGPGPSGIPLEQQAAAAAHLFNEYGAVGFAPAANNYNAGPAPALGYAVPDYGHSKLSASASVFVPNPTGNRPGPGPGPSSQQKPQHQQQYPQQRFMNGYNNHHQQQHHHHQQQPQQHQQYNNDMQYSKSVQNRLQQSQHNGAMGGGGNYYQQQVQTLPHQQQQQHHHQQHHHQPHQQSKYKHFNHHHQQHQQQHQYNNEMPQTKFHRHAHLNNSFQQMALQPSQPSTSSAAAAAAAAASSSSSSSSSSTSHPDMATIALEYLDTVIHCLNQNPGQFDTIASRFLTIFDGMEQNHYVLSIAMEDIFEKSIEQPNFRYMGAKLYNLLHMLNPKPDSLFHSLLKCKLDYHQEEVAKYMKSSEQQKVRETALFLAELYMQLRGDDDARIQLIAVNIVYSLRQLFFSESAENVRCICQTLKLAGYDLTADCPQDMLDIIAALQAIEAHSPGKYAMAANVIALQQNNWGRKVSNALGGEDESASVKEPPRLSDEPVFYGPDGRELTAEETDFLAAEDDATGSDDGDEFDVRDGDLDLDPEMDEETERAYKDFCKQGKQQQQQQQLQSQSNNKS